MPQFFRKSTRPGPRPEITASKQTRAAKPATGETPGAPASPDKTFGARATNASSQRQTDRRPGPANRPQPINRVRSQQATKPAPQKFNPQNAPVLKVLPLGGNGFVTQNMFVYEYGNDIVLVDCGMGFPSNDMLGIDIVLPLINSKANRGA